MCVVVMIFSIVVVESEYQQIQTEVQNNEKELAEVSTLKWMCCGKNWYYYHFLQLREESISIRKQMELAATQANKVMDDPFLLKNVESLDYE